MRWVCWDVRDTAMKRKSLFDLLIFVGLLLMLSAAGLAAYNLHTESAAGDTAAETMDTLTAFVEENSERQLPEALPDYELYPEMDMPEETINGLNYIGYLSIPALELNLPVITETTMPYLRIAPCRFSGSAYLENMVIGAHNYNTHFGRLKELNYGDKLAFTDMDGNVFAYEVADIEIIQPDQADYLRYCEYPLSLYTCTIGGQTRLTIRCSAAEE